MRKQKTELNTITNADLDRTVNQLRDRVGMPHLTVNVGFTDPKWPDWGYSLSPVLQEIRRERCIELAGEGFRFNDLKRWKAGKLLNHFRRGHRLDQLIIYRPQEIDQRILLTACLDAADNLMSILPS